MKKKTKHSYYVVFEGHEPGVYENWPDCQQQIRGYPGYRYKKYGTRVEAIESYNRYLYSFLKARLSPHQKTLKDKGFFAVYVGWKEGVYLSRKEAIEQTKGYYGHLYDEFSSLKEAMESLDLFFVTLFKYNVQSQNSNEFGL